MHDVIFLIINDNAENMAANCYINSQFHSHTGIIDSWWHNDLTLNDVEKSLQNAPLSPEIYSAFAKAGRKKYFNCLEERKLCHTRWKKHIMVRSWDILVLLTEYLHDLTGLSILLFQRLTQITIVWDHFRVFKTLL